MRLSVAAAIWMWTAVPAAAHHSFAAEFDGQHPVKLRGIVTAVDWVNPHSWIHLDVKSPDGATAAWVIECGSPNALLRLGFGKSSLAKGSEVEIDAFPAKDGTHRASGDAVVLTNGRKLFLRRPGG